MIKNENLGFKAQYNYKNTKFSQFIFSALALASVVLFAIWWFNPAHLPNNFSADSNIWDILLFLSVSYVIWHPIIMEVLSWAISSHIKDIREQKPVPGLKVAFITTIVPASESPALLHNCLPAMVNVKYPHDTWLLDEGDDPEVKAICAQYGVLHFSRFGKTEFNTPKGKFTKTKGGNHNSWYEVHGNEYDIVAQIDTDFVPKPNFLTKTLGYFRDPDVAFVGTPQVYGNTKDSIIAQGASEQLYTFYGSILRGLSSMKMTLLIGANHIIRVAALRDVNHYSAHITEDLITGMKLHTKGWKSVYMSYPLAIGEGPSTWESYFSQQMRWAYGCMDIFFNHSFKLFNRMEFRRAIYYFFLQQHYFSGIAMALSSFLLSLYFLAGLRAANIDLVKFVIVYTTIILICWLMSVWFQRYNVYRKHEGELLLAGNIISIAAWPIWFLAFLSVITRKRLKYKVTPKGEGETSHVSSPAVFIPHLFFGSVALVDFISAFFTGRQSPLMLLLAATATLLMFSVPFVELFNNALLKFRKRLRKVMYRLRKSYRNVEQKIRLELFPDRSQGQVVAMKTENVSFKSIVGDCLFLIFIGCMSFVFYLPKTGFYSDDWSFLGNFSLSANQSFWGLLKTATTPNTLMRPMQNVYDALLYWLFGLNPLGYQIVNAAVIISTTVLFYLVLRRLQLPRIIAISVPLVYSLLPNYSTDRFWYAVAQANVSMLFYFWSFYAALRATDIYTVKKVFWKTISLVFLVLSALSYEVVIPFFLLNAIILLRPIERLRNHSVRAKFLLQKPTIFSLLIIIILGYVFLFKALTTIRLSIIPDPQYIWYIVSSAFWVNYVTLGVHLPRIWGEIFSLYNNTNLFIASGILYIILFWYLYSVITQPGAFFPTSSWLRNLTFFSIIIFYFGYAIFFTNNQVGFSPTGIENRVAIAAAIGLALSIVGLGGWISKMLLPDKVARFFFCVFITIMCTGGFLVINTLGGFWTKAYAQGSTVLDSIYQTFPTLPKGVIFILDGTCPYVGPAPVFEAQWDLKGALQTHYHDPTLRADIVSPRLKVTSKSIRTQIYTFPTDYPYKNLFIYNLHTKTIYPIPNEQAAYDYFAKFNPGFNDSCPSNQAGEGVKVFQ